MISKTRNHVRKLKDRRQHEIESGVVKVQSGHALSILADSGLPQLFDKTPGDRSLIDGVLPTEETLIAVAHAVQQIRKMVESLLDTELANIVRGRFGAQAETACCTV